MREHHPSGGFGHSSALDDGVERFNASFYQDFLLHDPQKMSSLDGRTRLIEDGRVEITIDVDAKERLQFTVHGLGEVVMKRDGTSISESDANSDNYEIVLRAR